VRLEEQLDITPVDARAAATSYVDVYAAHFSTYFSSKQDPIHHAQELYERARRCGYLAPGKRL
jgi:hypothetical protein